uniref:Glycine N-acyltransferase-like protein n=1 Tax=Malurus cyaneus samueli TaxID=2593467 RepID=A0A8C5T6I5_9PASS
SRLPLQGSPAPTDSGLLQGECWRSWGPCSLGQDKDGDKDQLLNITRGNPGQFEVLVDKWPDFGGTRGCPQVPVNDGYWNTQTAFYRDLGNWTLSSTTPTGILTPAPCPSPGESPPLLSPRGDPPEPPLTPASPRLAPGVRVGSLQPSHVDLLNDTWPYGGNARSRRYLAEILGRFPHVCLQDGSGQPIAWVLTDHFGTGTHSYTLPEHRRHGHMQVALTVAAQRAQARGFPTFGHTALANRPMQQLQEMLGHQRLPGICRYILHNPSLDRDEP